LLQQSVTLRQSFSITISGVVNGSTTYDPETRTCGEGRYRVFAKIDQAASALEDADILYVRAGTYSRVSVGKYITVRGKKVNCWTGALAVNASGIPQKSKLVSAYKDELVIIQAKPSVSHYSPDPGDTTFKNSSHYYPHPAISIGGAYVDVVGFKTYGQLVISGHNIAILGCDLGGGGPHMNQGQVHHRKRSHRRDARHALPARTEESMTSLAKKSSCSATASVLVMIIAQATGAQTVGRRREVVGKTVANGSCGRVTCHQPYGHSLLP